MKRFVFTFVIFGAFLFLVSGANAQEQNKPAEQNQNQQRAMPEDIANADVVILANVRAKELKFEVVPNTKVEFFGKPERRTFWETDRQNLPESVQPGVTYRNIGIQLRIVSRFADIERIVAEALGEIPVSDAEPKPNRQTTAPEQNAHSHNKSKPETEAAKKPR
ncbi:MAG: hypothetical protein M3209_13945 [Acidobacteriota bacterium]|nr:hypothetical protein [Acidobacteriota bacterium]